MCKVHRELAVATHATVLSAASVHTQEPEQTIAEQFQQLWKQISIQQPLCISIYDTPSKRVENSPSLQAAVVRSYEECIDLAQHDFPGVHFTNFWMLPPVFTPSSQPKKTMPLLNSNRNG
eukprot:Gb_25114 [translate_table: standard]